MKPIKINPKSAIYTFQGKEYFDECDALAILLHASIIYPLSAKDKSTTLFVNLNDVFVWACADGEPITLSELESLYRLWLKWGVDGVIKWGCIKRNQQPQNPIKEQMIKDGHWDDILNNLPVNKYWSTCCKKET